jgi:hypothetical protein
MNYKKVYFFIVTNLRHKKTLFHNILPINLPKSKRIFTDLSINRQIGATIKKYTFL